jgi:hypothetical protein
MAAKNRKAVMGACNTQTASETTNSSEILEPAAKTGNPMSRPLLGSLGECLQATASHFPAGYTRIKGCTESFWRGKSINKTDEHWLVVDPVTACLEPAPVTIFIRAGTSVSTVREFLKQTTKWAKLSDRKLSKLTPLPRPPIEDDDGCPF